MKEKEQADATLQSLNFYEEDVARETRNNLAGSIKGADGEELTGDERERVAREFAEDKVAMDERRFGGTAMSAEERDELRIQASAASMRREMELGTREDYVEARILSQDEVDAIKAAAIGISKEDYQKAQEDPNYFQDSDAFSDEQLSIIHI